MFFGVVLSVFLAVRVVCAVGFFCVGWVSDGTSFVRIVFFFSCCGAFLWWGVVAAFGLRGRLECRSSDGCFILFLVFLQPILLTR